MPEPSTIEFEYKEVVEALIHYNNLHEGLWGLLIKFGIQGANISTEPSGQFMPAAIVPLLKIGLQRYDKVGDKPSNLIVDADKVNPLKNNSKK